MGDSAGEVLPAAGSPLPTGPEFDLILRQAQVLARSTLVPAAYRGRPENIVLAALAGRAFGWDPTMAMRSFHIIEGQPTLKPEIMLALIRRAGHHVQGSWTGEGADIAATVTGTRADTGDTMTVSFSVRDAERAGLCTIRDGAPRARSSSGKPLPWEQYPKAMCWARAVSALGRALFLDVLLGVSYVPEELGAVVDGEGDVIDAESVEVVDPATVERLRDRANRLSGPDRKQLKRLFAEHDVTGFPEVPVTQLELVEQLIGNFEDTAQPGEGSVCDTGRLTFEDALRVASLPAEQLAELPVGELRAVCDLLGVDNDTDNVNLLVSRLVAAGEEF